MKRAHKIANAAVLFLATSLSNPCDSMAVTAAEQLRETWQQIVLILKSARLDSESETAFIRTKIMQVVWPRFDFAEMAKRCLGPHWGERSAEERDEFVKAFGAMLSRAYIGNIPAYENAHVLFTRESNETDDAEVDTKIVTDGSKDLFVNYKLRRVDADWKIYDVIIDDISVLANFRSQFQRVIARSSFAELLRIMREKQP
jgi:phospholipid transport system substrate-binding protein